jgi:Protein of unknown function (DUF1573)
MKTDALKTALLTIASLSLFTICLIELSGVSKTALINKFKSAENIDEMQDPIINQVNQMPKTQLTFEQTDYHFPDTTEGSILKHYFKFKNTGTQALVIAKAVASCGCTVPSFPKYPIAPGQSDSILLEFDSHNRIGQNHKNVLIYSNHEGGSLSIGFNVLIK